MGLDADQKIIEEIYNELKKLRLIIFVIVLIVLNVAYTKQTFY